MECLLAAVGKVRRETVRKAVESPTQLSLCTSGRSTAAILGRQLELPPEPHMQARPTC